MENRKWKISIIDEFITLLFYSLVTENIDDYCINWAVLVAFGILFVIFGCCLKNCCGYEEDPRDRAIVMHNCNGHIRGLQGAWLQ